MTFERALLYVGPPKTGTTSIQAFVWKNRDALMAKGVYAPLTGRSNGQHVELAALLAQNARKSRRERLNFQADIGPLAAGTRKEEHLADLRRELSAAPAGHTLLFMSEAIFPSAKDEIRAWRAVCAPYAARFESLMYLRRQDRWLASRTLQNRKVGSRAGLDLNVGNPRRFATNVRAWHSQSDRCHIRRFEPEFLIGASLTEDFCDAIGVETHGLDMTDVRENPALLQEQLELVDALNAALAPLPFERQVFYRTAFLALTARRLGGTRIEFPRHVAVAAFESFGDINLWLRETVDPAGPPHFFNTDFSGYEAAPRNARRYALEALRGLLGAISPETPSDPSRAALVSAIVSAFLSLPDAEVETARRGPAPAPGA